jgi:DNA-binding transcriptional LysR family regulator
MDRLDEFALLLAIIERGSLSGAARKTGRSPAAVTRILNEMEARLRVRLVELRIPLKVNADSTPS